MFNVLSHQGNANQNESEFSSKPLRLAKIKTQARVHAGKDVEQEMNVPPF